MPKPRIQYFGDLGFCCFSPFCVGFASTMSGAYKAWLSEYGRLNYLAMGRVY